METKVVQTIEEAAQFTQVILDRFGHHSVASAIAQVPTLAPVFAGMFDLIRGLLSHKAAAATAATKPTA